MDQSQPRLKYCGIAHAETRRHLEPVTEAEWKAKPPSFVRAVAIAAIHQCARSASSIAGWRIERDIGHGPAAKPGTD
jgi:hypothetical protein